MADREIRSLMQETANGVLRGVDALLTSVETASPSAAGDTTVAVVASARDIKPHIVVLLTPAAGAGPYSRNIVLSVANHAPGDIVDVVYTQPASTNPTAVFKNATAGGTTLLTVSGAASEKASARFVFNGTAWVLAGAAQFETSVTLA